MDHDAINERCARALIARLNQQGAANKTAVDPTCNPIRRTVRPDTARRDAKQAASRAGNMTPSLNETESAATSAGSGANDTQQTGRE